jgi:hypothetical protein
VGDDGRIILKRTYVELHEYKFLDFHPNFSNHFTYTDSIKIEAFITRKGDAQLGIKTEKPEITINVNLHPFNYT